MLPGRSFIGKRFPFPVLRCCPLPANAGDDDLLVHGTSDRGRGQDGGGGGTRSPATAKGKPGNNGV